MIGACPHELHERSLLSHAKYTNRGIHLLPVVVMERVQIMQMFDEKYSQSQVIAWESREIGRYWAWSNNDYG